MWLLNKANDSFFNLTINVFSYNYSNICRFVMILLINNHKTCTLKEKILTLMSRIKLPLISLIRTPNRSTYVFHTISLLMSKVHICLPYSLIRIDGLVTCLSCQGFSITICFHINYSARLLVYLVVKDDFVPYRFDTWHQS